MSSDAHDFDFLHGSWRVHNRRLVAPLTGSDEWVEFDGTSRVQPLWDGQANFEEWEADAPGGHLSAVSLHIYSPRERQWSLHWATRSSGRVGTPTVGKFANSRGVFYNRERYRDKPILLRIVWEPLGANACRFEQAFSTNEGSTWEPNWIMDFTRTADAAPATSDFGASRDARRDFDFLHGRWRVHHRRLRAPLSGRAEWYEFDGSSIEIPLFQGDANLEEVEATLPDGTPLRGLALRLYDGESKQWSIHWSSGANGTLDPPMQGKFVNGRGEFFGPEQVDGRAVCARFHWTSLGADRARWEQAFSPDGGASWETNWIMEFTREA